MIFPLQVLQGSGEELNLAAAVAIGFGFGFVLERAGFGRAPKLAAQFYLTDMTVFKVMFSAIVTAMLGLVVLDAVGLADLKALSDLAASPTFLWPMIAGGFLLGLGFIIAGYCPGTSLVSAASGNLDGLAAFLGVIAGTVVYSESFPLVSKFHDLGDFGHLYLYELVKLPPAVVAAAVVAMAVGCFIGAEWVERFMARKASALPGDDRWPRAPRRLAFATFGLLALVGLGGLALPRSEAQAVRAPILMGPEELARRVIDEPWTLRILDLRDKEACAAARVPGAECVAGEITALWLSEDASGRDLVLIGGSDQADAPAAMASYPGRVFALRGGFAAWQEYALTPPKAPAPEASAEEIARYRRQGAVNAAMTGTKQAPPPSVPVKGGAPRKKKGGGGCS